MGREQPDPAADADDRLASRRLEPADYFGGVTLLGALLMAMAGAVVEVLFLALTFMAIVLVRRLALPTAFEFAIAIGIVLQGWGNALLLFERIAWYDKAVHFLTPMLVVPSLYLMLARASVLPPLGSNGLRRATLGVLVVATSLGIALATLWELVEGTADRFLNTTLAHGYFETINDLYSSVLGSVAAGALLAWLLTADRLELVSAQAVAERE